MSAAPYDDRPTHTAGYGAGGSKWHLVSGYGPGGDAAAHCNSEMRLTKTIPSAQVPRELRCRRCGRKNSWPPYMQRMVWLAWHPRDKPPPKNTLPYYGGVGLDGTFYHGGGLSHMMFPKDAVVLKEYGNLSVEEADDKGIDDQFLDDFKPEAGSPDEAVELSSCWVAPDGDIYPCEYGKHRSLAKRLRRHMGIQDVNNDRMIFTQVEEALMSHQWLRISPHAVSVNWDVRGVPTPAQARVVQNVRVIAGEHAKVHEGTHYGKVCFGLEEVCRFFMEHHTPILRKP